MTVRETVDAKKERFGAKDLKELFADAKTVVVAKGKKVVTFDMAGDPPSKADFEKHVLGPTGNLRAPAIRSGKSWHIGFNEEAYAETF